MSMHVYSVCKLCAHVGHGKVNINCFENSETIAVSMATHVTVHDVHMTQWNHFSVMRSG